MSKKLRLADIVGPTFLREIAEKLQESASPSHPPSLLTLRTDTLPDGRVAVTSDFCRGFGGKNGKRNKPSMGQVRSNWAFRPNRWRA